MGNQTWKDLPTSVADRVHDYLLQNGGLLQEVKTKYEIWRIRFSDSTFTYYSSGKLTSTPSRSMDPAVEAAWSWIHEQSGPRFVPSQRDFLIGLDEAGKGELLGHVVLTGALIPNHLFDAGEQLIGVADTKTKHASSYWDDLFKQIDSLREEGLRFAFEKIPPWHVDRYNLNKIIDITYQRILSRFLRTVSIGQARIVLDDYGIGDTLTRFLRFLEKQGAEIVVTSKADENYIEARLASVIAKRTQTVVLEAIRRDPDFAVDGLSVGSGNAGDAKTLAWLQAWHATGKPWPWFVRKTWKTVRELEGRSGRPKKLIPPIRDDLLAAKFLEEFNRGRLSIESLAVICPHCGNVLRSVAFASFDGKSGLKCSNCGNLIQNAGLTLRYYCGYVVPDTNAIGRQILSRDLEADKFFENWTVILCPTVRFEADGAKRSKKELDELRKFADKGRIRLECPGSVKGITGLSSTERDERIIAACKENDAILLTGDKSAGGFAAGKGVFSIVI